MRVAFDEHVPTALVRVLQSFSSERQFRKLSGGYQIELARDYTPKPSDQDYLKGSDEPWIKRYAASGGQVIISGDTNMMSEPHERLALLEERMIVCFFSSHWSNWKFFKKCALAINWWPAIAQTASTAERSTFWRIPTSWEEGGQLVALPTDDRQLIRIARQRERQAKVAAARRAQREALSGEAQGKLNLPERSPAGAPKG